MKVAIISYGVEDKARNGRYDSSDGAHVYGKENTFFVQNQAFCAAKTAQTSRVYATIQGVLS